MTILTDRANSLEQHWMPFTANRSFKSKPRLISQSGGMYYTSDRGDTILDGSSGLFCVAAGHGRREIADAVHRTLLESDYIPPFQFGRRCRRTPSRSQPVSRPPGVPHRCGQRPVR